MNEGHRGRKAQKVAGCPEYTEAWPAQGDTWEVGGGCGVLILLTSVSSPPWDHAFEALLFPLESLCPFQACRVHTVSQRLGLSWSLFPPTEHSSSSF